MTNSEEQALDLLGTFLRAHYHEPQLDIEGTTEVLEIWPPGDPYRKELSQGLRLLMEAPLPEGTLTSLVQNEANRAVSNDVEAREYLKYLYDDLHLDWEEEEN